MVVVVPCIMLMLCSASFGKTVYYIIEYMIYQSWVDPLNSCRSAVEHVLHADLRHKSLNRAYVQSWVDNVDRSSG